MTYFQPTVLQAASAPEGRGEREEAMTDLCFMPAHELAELIRTKKLSPVELLEACLARVEETNGALNAFIATKPERALAEARSLADRNSSW